MSIISQFLKRMYFQDIPGSPVRKTVPFELTGGSIPGQGSKRPHAMPHSQEDIFFKKEYVFGKNRNSSKLSQTR